MRQTTKTPLVSIGLPVFNGARFLSESLDSLLSQSVSDLEIIVSDNASTDGTRDIVEAYARRDGRIRCHRHAENLGAAANYNFVFEQSSGKYFKWASHDDKCDPNFLRETIAALEKEKDACLAYTDVVQIDAHGESTGYLQRAIGIDGDSVVERLQAFFRYYNHGREANAVFGLIRREALARTGLIGRYPSSDIVLLANLALLGKWAYVPQLLFFRRYHDGMSIKANATVMDMAKWFDPSLANYREGKTIRLLKEYVRVIGYARLGVTTKLGSYRHLAHWAWKQRRRLFQQLIGSMR